MILFFTDNMLGLFYSGYTEIITNNVFSNSLQNVLVTQDIDLRSVFSDPTFSFLQPSPQIIIYQTGLKIQYLNGCVQKGIEIQYSFYNSTTIRLALRLFNTSGCSSSPTA
jgi:hypothetical protein